MILWYIIYKDLIEVILYSPKSCFLVLLYLQSYFIINESEPADLSALILFTERKRFELENGIAGGKMKGNLCKQTSHAKNDVILKCVRIF